MGFRYVKFYYNLFLIIISRDEKRQKKGSGSAFFFFFSDEDFFSCNNPYRDRFEANFGIQNWNVVRKLYDIGYPHDLLLKQILKQKLFEKTMVEFMKISVRLFFCFFPKIIIYFLQSYS